MSVALSPDLMIREIVGEEVEFAIRPERVRLEANRKALLATDMKPDQMIMPWKGVKFDPATGQNELGTPLMTQWRGGQRKVVWPFELASTDVLYPRPKWLDRK